MKQKLAGLDPLLPSKKDIGTAEIFMIFTIIRKSRASVQRVTYPEKARKFPIMVKIRKI